MRFAPATAHDRVSARHIPAGSTEDRHADADAVVYSYPGKHGELYAIAYAGTAYRPAFHFRFKTDAQRAQHVDAWIASQRARVERRRARQAEKKDARHELQVGDIVSASWGYEQTNVDFYQVIRVVSSKSVELRHLQQSTTETGFMCGTTHGLKDQFTDEAPMVRRAEGVAVLNIGSSRGSASKWDGRPRSCSWYA